MSGKNSFIIFYELEEQTTDFSDAQLGQLLRAIFEFEKRGNMPVITDIAVRTAFKFVSAQLDRGKAKYDDVCSKRQEAGKKGGRPAKAKDLKEKQKKLIVILNVIVIVIVNVTLRVFLTLNVTLRVIVNVRVRRKALSRLYIQAKNPLL